MGARNRAAVVAWPAVIVAAAAIACSLAMMLVAREPDAPPVARKGDRDALLARKGDYLIPRVNAPADLASRWVPLAPAVAMGEGLPSKGLPSMGGLSPPPPNPPSSPASEPVRTEPATPHHQAHVHHHHRDVCAAHGMRRRSRRCVR